jgi:hypothetical protein
MIASIGSCGANVLRRFMKQLSAVLLVFVFFSCKGPTTSEPNTPVTPIVQKPKTFMQMVQDTLHGFWTWYDSNNINFGDSYTLHFNDQFGDSAGDGAWYETDKYGYKVGSQRDFWYRILPNMDTNMVRFLHGAFGDTLTFVTIGGLGIGIVDTIKIVMYDGHSFEVIYGSYETMQGVYPNTEWGIISGYRYWKN